MSKTYLRWEELTPAQKKHVMRINKWKPEDYQLWMYPLRKDGQLYQAKGHHVPTPEYAKAMLQDMEDARHQRGRWAIRSKGDLRDWKPGHSFTFLKG